MEPPRGYQPEDPLVGRVSALLPALRRAQIELGEVVIVVGAGETARLATDLARAAGAQDCELIDSAGVGLTGRDACADVLIYLAEDAQGLAGVLRLVRERGRALLVGGTAGGAIDYDPYPDLHRRSIKLIGATLEAAPSREILAAARRLLANGRLAPAGRAEDR